MTTQTTTPTPAEVTLPALLRATQCFVHPGPVDSIIDMVNPDTGRSCVYGETLDELRVRYPGTVIRNFYALLSEKAAEQNRPGEWLDCSAERYEQMLGVLPPAAMKSGAFMVGEAVDHHSGTGRARFRAFRANRGEGTFSEYSRPMTFAEFKAEFGACAYFYQS